MGFTMFNAVIIALVICGGATVFPTPANGADLKSDLHEFAALVPRRRIGFIAARHFLLDSSFRKALNYIRSPDFPIVCQQMQETSEYHRIVAYIAKSAPSYDVTSVINSIPMRLRAYKMPSKVPPEELLARNFGSFLKEALRAFPKARIASLLARKVQEGGEFSQLYRALRRDEFRQLIDQARNSPNLMEPLERLSQHSIDVDDLIEVAFDILKWGPQ